MQLFRSTKTQTKRPSLSISSLVIVVCLLAFLCTSVNASPVGALEKRDEWDAGDSTDAKYICVGSSTVAADNYVANRAPVTGTATATATDCPTATVDPNDPAETDFPSYVNDEYYKLTGSEITLTAGTIGTAFIIIGIYFGVFGYRYFRITLGMVGMLLFAALTYIALVNAEPYWGYSQPNHIIFTAIPFAMGVLGAVIFAFFHNVGRYIVGGLGGFVFVLYVLAYQKDHIIVSTVARYCTIVAVFFLGCFLVFMLETYIILFATSFMGAFFLMFGLDLFVHVGYVNATRSLLDGNYKYHDYSLNWRMYTMLGTTLLLTLIFFGWQFIYNAGRKFGHVLLVAGAAAVVGAEVAKHH